MEQYRSKILNKYVPVENFNASEDINWGGEDIKENIKFQLKAVYVMYEWQQAKLWWFLDPYNNVDNLNNVKT